MNNTRYLAGGVVILGAMIALVTTGMRSATMSSVPVDKVRAADGTPKSYVGQRLRVVGFVGHSKLKRTPVQTEAGTVEVAHFEVEDKGKVMQVSFRDALPDTFRAGGPVQVDGRYIAPGKIEAEHVLTKCPSKYEAAKPAPKKENAAGKPVSPPADSARADSARADSNVSAATDAPA